MTIVKELSISDVSELYQTCYGGFEVDAASWDNTQLISTIRKNEKFNGNELKIAQMQDVGGGFAAGGLPNSSTPSIINPVLTAKSIYSTSVIDNQSMKAARRSGTNLGAFEDAVSLSMQVLKSSFQDNMARQFLGDGTGELGAIDSVVINSAGDYTMTITDASWVEANWILNDLLNISTSQDLFYVSEIDLTLKTVRVLRQNGSHVPLAGEKIYKQKSKDNEKWQEALKTAWLTVAPPKLVMKYFPG